MLVTRQHGEKALVFSQLHSGELDFVCSIWAHLKVSFFSLYIQSIINQAHYGYSRERGGCLHAGAWSSGSPSLQKSWLGVKTWKSQLKRESEQWRVEGSNQKWDNSKRRKWGSTCSFLLVSSKNRGIGSDAIITINGQWSNSLHYSGIVIIIIMNKGSIIIINDGLWRVCRNNSDSGQTYSIHYRQEDNGGDVMITTLKWLNNNKAWLNATSDAHKGSCFSPFAIQFTLLPGLFSDA